jgi:cytochrome b involved in lipid metabolism
MQAIRRGRFGPAGSSKRDGEVAHLEDPSKELQEPAKNNSDSTKQFPFVPETLSDAALPFITKDLVLQRSNQAKSSLTDEEKERNKEHWIVIDQIVYDCSEFAYEHPGGESVILSFVGEDCSWQFWRLHSKSLMEQYGRALRVGRTEGIQNRFPETARYVGLSSLGDDGW